MMNIITCRNTMFGALFAAFMLPLVLTSHAQAGGVSIQLGFGTNNGYYDRPYHCNRFGCRESLFAINGNRFFGKPRIAKLSLRQIRHKLRYHGYRHIRFIDNNRRNAFVIASKRNRHYRLVVDLRSGKIKRRNRTRRF